ncbi:hypothetical protein [Solirubrobacter soli]|uniref:hypothetical protein n=1 Tax=Solirubrobacter soli TaxID=363832 RepID=UPI0004097CF0|nr:hypothetical protein [Solirubrobacter soli]
MPWIEIVEPGDASGVLAEAYEWQARKLGEPAAFTKLGSLYPELVLERLRLYKVVEACPSSLTPVERAFAAFVTSSLNGTPHCGSGLRLKLGELGVDPDAPGDDPRLTAIREYAAKLTSAPGTVAAGDIEALRSVGLGDLEILDVNNIVAYYNYINRVANGLGLREPIATAHEALGAVPA